MRARIRPTAERLDDGLVCCDVARQLSLKADGLIVEITGQARMLEAICRSCGAQHMAMHYRVLGQEFDWVFVSSVDIDEGV
jgi:hypothetical protein